MNWMQPNQVLVQGIMEAEALHYLEQMKAYGKYGTKIIAGVSPGQGGEQINSIPIFDLVEDAIQQIGEVEATLIFVPPYQVLDAALEAIAAGIKQIIIFTKNVPPLDIISLIRQASRTRTLIVGPGSNGIIIPDRIALGSFNFQCYTPGNVALISPTQHLSDEVAWVLKSKDLGESFVVTLGNEKITGSSFQQWLSILNTDEQTEAIVIIGVPGSGQEEAAVYYQNLEIKKPVIAYMVGLQAPRERMFRDATTIIANQLSYSVPSSNTDKEILATLTKAGIKVVKRPEEIPPLLKKVLAKKS
jgi:succinyl-CoA synthetase alpha subunit